jgi:hypothetical protein
MHSSTLFTKFDEMFITISFNRTSAELDVNFYSDEEDISSFLTKMSLLKDIDSITISLQAPEEDAQPEKLRSFLENEVIDKISLTIIQQDPIKFKFQIVAFDSSFRHFINILITIWKTKSLNIIGLEISGATVDGNTIKDLVAFLKTTQLQDFCLKDTKSKVSEDDYIFLIQLLQDLKNYLTSFSIGNVNITRGEITNKLLKEIFLKIKDTKLQFLKISDMEKIEDDTLKIMKQCFKENTSLNTLDFGGSENGLKQDGKVIKKIFNAIKHSKSIIDIDVCYHNITDEYMFDIAESLKVNQQIQNINFSNTHLSETGMLTLADALRFNKSITHLELDEATDDYSYPSEKTWEKINKYLKCNRELNKNYCQVNENLELADQQANSANPTIEQIEKVNRAYQLAIDQTKSILKNGYPKSQDLLDRCYINYGLHLLRTRNYAAGYQCFNAIDKSSSYYSLKQNELASFLISYKPDQEHEIQHRERLIDALSLVPDLYSESCPAPFRKIYLELMGEDEVDIQVVGTWQEIQKVNRDKFNEVAIQIQKRQFHDAGVQPIIWDFQNQLVILQNQITDLQNENSSCQQIMTKNPEVSSFASGLFGAPKKRKREEENSKPGEEDNVDPGCCIKSP